MSSETPKNRHEDVGAANPSETKGKKPYEAPRIEKRRSVARVTLLSGTGNMGVGVLQTMSAMP